MKTQASALSKTPPQNKNYKGWGMQLSGRASLGSIPSKYNNNNKILLYQNSKSTNYFYLLETVRGGDSVYLEPPVILGDRVSKVNLLSLAHKLLEFWVLFHPNVITDEVPVNTVSPSLLLVQQQI